jgi:serine/threonine protein kinase
MPTTTFTIQGEELQLGPRIGKGAYGEVFRAKWRGIDVAVKKMPCSLLQNKEFLNDFQQEAKIMVSVEERVEGEMVFSFLFFFSAFRALFVIRMCYNSLAVVFSIAMSVSSQNIW